MFLVCCSRSADFFLTLATLFSSAWTRVNGGDILTISTSVIITDEYFVDKSLVRQILIRAKAGDCDRLTKYLFKSRINSETF